MTGKGMDMEYDAIVVGAGIAGLIATAYLSKQVFGRCCVRKNTPAVD
jgi:cation diffusion facilitator CzcD-associated flavoprotein CzcO